ncbi:MAG: flagellar biosynthesis anti-sigma factor FlgM [Spirochaetia bacterium]|nr:flagellar biosynthesis anti-sigma factor FlgM [Spirochaetia bacterium]
MIVDKIGGTGPGYGPRKTENTTKPAHPARSSDNVVISEEAARAAETAKIARLASGTEDQSRVEKLRIIKEKLNNGEYNNLSDDILNKTARNLSDTLFG